MEQETALISSLAVVHPDAQIGIGVQIDAFATVEPNTVIGDYTHIHQGAIIKSGSRIGQHCQVHPYAVVGNIPQDLKFKGEETTAVIGNHTTLREFVTINRGTASRNTTRVGDNCLIMAYCHVAHDCVLGNSLIIGNGTQIAGEVEIDDFSTISGGVLIHQFVRISQHVMIQGGSLVGKDIPPYTLIGREPISYCGINSVGLRRRGFQNEQIFLINDIYRLLYQSGMNKTEVLKEIEKNYADCYERNLILDFIKNSERGIVRGSME